jgi:DNA-binding MarR family transcriptional regulator
MSEDIQKVFLNEKPVKILTQIEKSREDNYASAIAKDIDATYSHTVRCLKTLENKGLVEFEKKGRKKKAFLTDKGEMVARDFYKLLEDLTSDPE